MIDLQEVITLYTQCFPEDSTAVTELFFEKKLGLDNCYYLEEENNIACQLFIVNKTLFYLNNYVLLPFIVGLGTAKIHRNKGLANVLMTKVLNALNSPFVALYPFSHLFYQKMGFATVSHDYTYTHKTTPIKLNVVKALYDNYIMDKDYYIVRSQEDFLWFEAVMSADKVPYLQTVPDGYTNGEETVIMGKEGNIPGTMLRIVNLESALKLSNVDLPPIKIVDNFIAKNNVIIRVEKGKMIPCDSYKWEVSIEKLCLILFGKSEMPFPLPKLKGHILDRY